MTSEESSRVHVFLVAPEALDDSIHDLAMTVILQDLHMLLFHAFSHSKCNASLSYHILK